MDKLEFTDAERRIIGEKNPGLSPDEMAVFLSKIDRYQLDPLSNQIYAVKRGGRLTFMVGIDGSRLLADRSGAYAGSDDAEFTAGDKYPMAAGVTVWKLVGGQRCPFAATARWDEYYPGESKAGTMWRKMPHVMLAKVAEALALRKGFPAQLAGVYVKEELDQSADVEPKPDAKPAKPRSKPVPVKGGPQAETSQEADEAHRKDDIFQRVHSRILAAETGEKLLEEVIPGLKKMWKEKTLDTAEVMALLPHVVTVADDFSDASTITQAVEDLRAELKGKLQDGTVTETAKQADEVF